MVWMIYLVLFACVTTGHTINRPVYKITLKQKGYAQFLQYDIETPPIREFTFCTWVRVSDLDNDQSIFTYVANGNIRVVRLWLDTGGRYAKISIDDKVLSKILIDFEKDTWRHICLSYQSDHGAWALYIDSRLVSCEAAQSLYGRILPGGGSIIVGYGIANNGIPNGLEGEIFGVNMILTSTIERNYTIKSHPQYKQKSFHKNKVTGNDNLEYIVLGDMKSENVKKRGWPEISSSPHRNASKNYIKFKTPYSFFEHDVGQAVPSINTISSDASIEQEILDLPSTNTTRVIDKDKINFWKIINEAGSIGKFKSNMNTKISVSGTQSHPTISEYETPPPFKPLFRNSISFHSNAANNILESNPNTNNHLTVSDIEMPPPPSTSNKVYGQWTSSKFASSVLNYLKSINFNQREPKKVPPTIPLLKVSDSFPYATDMKVSKVRPSFKFQRRNFIDRRLHKQKREANNPEINVRILQDDLRQQIIKSHAQTQPKNVEVTNRGKSIKNREHKFDRAEEIQQSNEDSSSNEIIKLKPFNALTDFKLNTNSNDSKKNRLLTILPFLKTLEYYIENLDANKKEKATSQQISTSSSDVYSKSLSNANKWHNVKSYSNDYTPRQINMESSLQNNIHEKIVETNKKLPLIRLRYKPESQQIKSITDARIIQGRNMASDISNQSNHNINSVSLIKYNHGFLPSHDIKTMSSNKHNHILGDSKEPLNKFNKNNFHKSVKLGNALNEQNIIGHNEKQNKQSFVGGDERIPDVNKYRSMKHETDVPPSLGPRICKNVELYDRLFYVQPDGSIDVTHILSPVRERNVGIEFIMQNYKKCSFENSELQESPLLFIDWNRTPVRLFGGAFPKKTTDLCGFF